ncbi:MAG: Mur ligase family protein [Gemmatimonadota bacterium]
MTHWTEDDVLHALPIAERVKRNGDGRPEFDAVATDTRALPAGALFVALRGERFDAHDYLSAAVDAGARAAVVERVPQSAPALTYYQVPDTLSALGKLARYRRRQIKAPVCAVTGTNGKTTTKEMLRVVLEVRYRVHATAGNLNNLVGAPLTILSTPADAEALIVEIGTNAFGEIARLAEIVEPDLAMITQPGGCAPGEDVASPTPAARRDGLRSGRAAGAGGACPVAGAPGTGRGLDGPGRPGPACRRDPPGRRGARSLPLAGP